MNISDKSFLEDAYKDILIMESWKKLLASAGFAASLLQGVDAVDPNPQKIPLPDREIYYKMKDVRLKSLENLKRIVFMWKNLGIQSLEEVEEFEGRGAIKTLSDKYAGNLFPHDHPHDAERLFRRGLKILLNTPNSVFINK